MKLIPIESGFKDSIKLPFIINKIAAGFPSPAEDYKEGSLSLDELIIQHPLSTFFARVEGDSLAEANVQEDDIAVIDKSISPRNGDHVLAWLEGKGFTIKRYTKTLDKVILYPANKKYPPINLSEFENAQLWGVVVAYIRKMK